LQLRSLGTLRQPRDDSIGALNDVAPEVTCFVPSTAKPSIQSLLLEEIAAYLATQNQRPYRAKQIADWIYEKRVSSFEEMTDLPQDLRNRLAEEFSFGGVETVRVLGSEDTTRKFLFRLCDGNLIESVLIPASPALYGATSDRRTICVSTQVGCAYGCKFCASGLDGWTRNLDAAEIVQQLLAVEKASGERIDNVVFMGMGEPLANLANVVRAIRIINAPWGMEIGARHITVSTSGLAPQIRQLADEPLQSRLAISLHGATDAVRSQIMPVNRKYDLNALLSACDYYASRKKQRIYFEYILIADVNDAEEQAHLLAGHARRVGAKVNLIPYNSVEGLEWSRPSRQRQERFLSILRGHGTVATLRREKGHDIAAACGQLRLQAKRQDLLQPSMP
jgi:23S rRNA (adenine2503-C2)-methyltransferase